MEVKTPNGVKYLLYNEKRHGVFLSYKKDIKGMKEIDSLATLDKLIPRSHPWRLTEKGGVTWRTEEEIAAYQAAKKASRERGAKRRAEAAERRIANRVAREVKAARIAERRATINDILDGKYPKLSQRFEAIQKRKSIEALKQQKAALDAAISTLRPKKKVVEVAVVK